MICELYLKYGCLENPMDGGVHGVAESRTRLSDFTFKALLERDRLKIKMVKHTRTVLGIWTDSARSNMKSVSDHPNAGTDYKKKKNHKQIKSMPGREGKNGTKHPKPRAVNSAGMLACCEALRCR